MFYGNKSDHKNNRGSPITSLGHRIENFVFTQSYANGEGFKSKNQYKLRNKKMLIKKDNSMNANYILDKNTGEKLFIANIHFQGKQKKYLNTRMVKWLNY